MKICSTCKETKELKEFSNYSYSSDGLQPRCKQCTNENNAKTNPYFNKLSMYINGKYISRKHPLYKPGRYKSYDDAWSHVELDERTTEGYVYIISNKAWSNWYKVGKAVSADDRLNGYQTSSPYRDYELLYAVAVENRHQAEAQAHKKLKEISEHEHYSGEWFNIALDKIKEVLDTVEAEQKQLDLFEEAS